MVHNSVFVCVSNEILKWDQHTERRKPPTYVAYTAFFNLGLSQVFKSNFKSTVLK